MSKTIAISQIKLGPRQRKVIERQSVEMLAKSIETKGLLHAIVCRNTEMNELQLVAGERRLRAIKLLASQNRLFSYDGIPVIPDEIPYVLIDQDFDEIQIREVELEENIERVDLSWQDKVTALDELHELRLARNPKQSITKTANEVKEATGFTAKHSRRILSQARLIAPHLDDLEVSHASNINQACRIVSKKLEAELTIELNKRGEGIKTKHTLIQADFKLNLALPNDFTCIIADPPYGMNADKFGNAAQLTHTYEDNPEIALEIAKHIISHGFNLTKSEAHLYLFCDVEHFLTLRLYANEAGWQVFRTPIIWSKVSTTYHAPLLNRGFRRSYELILFASKGNKPFAQVYSDVWLCAVQASREVAAQKPVELYKTMLTRSCFPGDKVLDPCCGSGTIFKAAEDLNCIAYGVEKQASSYAIAQLTLSSLGNTSDE